MLRALALLAVVLLTSGACSLLAPSDAELMGGAAQPSNAGGEAAAGENDGSSSQGGTAQGGSTHAGATQGGSSESAGAPQEPDVPGSGGEGGARGLGGQGGEADFSTLIPQQGLALWLMADHGVAELEGGGVAVWADFSLNEADAKQSIGALQPHLAAMADGSLPVVEFDGADDQLALPAGFADFSAGITAFIIASASSEQTCPSLLHLSNEPEQQDIEIGRFHGAPHYEVADREVTGPDNTFGLEQLVLVGVAQSPANPPEVRLNGVFMASGDFTSLPEVRKRSNNFIGRSLYGGCEPFHGTIGEIILYSRGLVASEREQVQRYLQGKWSYEPAVKTKPGPGERTY